MLFAQISAQIDFIEIPIDRQLIPRNSITNLGELKIQGEVVRERTPYDSINIRLFREDSLLQSDTRYLTFHNGTALLDFSYFIVSELANYSIEIYGITRTSSTLEKSVNDIVVGDVYIITGQSNAEARKFPNNVSANTNQSQFIRVYASGSADSCGLVNNHNWYLGDGDGSRESDGNTGQWGLTLARMLVDTFKIPIAIFNSAHGGKEIAFFQAPDDYLTSVNSNYGRLYYRLNNNGLTDHVKAILWSQGERDSDTSSATSTEEYIQAFLTLKQSWRKDYPGVEHIYIFQTKNGCKKDLANLMQIKEAQRQLAFNDSSVHIMPTSALASYEDTCHFKYINGYESFAKRIFAPLSRDFYGSITNKEIEPPMVIDSYLLNDTILCLKTDAADLTISGDLTHDSLDLSDYFSIEDSYNILITDICVLGNTIILTLSAKPSFSSSITYFGDIGLDHFITNRNGIELVCFNKYPIRHIENILHPVSISACNQYLSPSGKFIWTESGTYFDIIPNSAGCDSIVEIQLDIESCVNTIQNTRGVTNVFPNPTTEYITIRLDQSYKTILLKVYNYLGQIIDTKNYHHASELVYNFKSQQGAYFVELVLDNKKKETIKVWKE